MQQESTWVKTVNNIDKFYNTNLSLWFFVGITTFFAIIQVVVYSCNIMAVNGLTIAEAADKDKLLSSWILLTASIISCYAGFIGGVMLFRGDLSFVYWQNTSTLLSFVTQLLATMYMGAFVSIYFFFMNTLRYFVWKHGWIEKWNLSNKTLFHFFVITFITLLVLLNLIVSIWGDQIYSAGSDWMNPYNYNFDATGASMNMMGSLMLMFRNRWAFLFFATAKIFTIWNYADAGLIVPIVQMSLFWIMDFTGFVKWSIVEVDSSKIENNLIIEV